MLGSIHRHVPAVPLLVLALLILPPAAAAHSYRLGEIAIGHLWAPPTAGSAGTAVYGPLLQRGAEAMTLESASSPIAERVRIRSAAEGEEQFADELVLPPGKPVSLAPWRQHLWLEGLERPLADGESFPLTLDFGAAGTIEVEVMVETAPSD